MVFFCVFLKESLGLHPISMNNSKRSVEALAKFPIKVTETAVDGFAVSFKLVFVLFIQNYLIHGLNTSDVKIYAL